MHVHSTEAELHRTTHLTVLPLGDGLSSREGASDVDWQSQALLCSLGTLFLRICGLMTMPIPPIASDL